MNKHDLLARHDYERRWLATPGYEHEVGEVISRDISINPMWRSSVTWAHFAPEVASEVIAAEVAYFAERERAFEWKVFGHDDPPYLCDHLAAAGFGVGPEMAFMVLDTWSPAADRWRAPIQKEVRKVDSYAALDDYVAVEQAVWEEAERQRWLALLHNAPEYTSLYVAYVDGVPASCARASFHPESAFCGLWGGATQTQYRSQGFYTTLVAARIHEAMSRGVRFITIEAAPSSRPILERRGFEVLDTVYLCRPL